jgi:tetratricopeptide (TPR) repeat protein
MNNINFQKINNIVGWVVFLFATSVYTLTVEPTASFWDCGEFIAVSYKLMVPHPPGAPFFLILGRIMSMFAFGDVMKVAFWINMLSVIASGFTILFLYWSIVLLGKKIIKPETNGAYTKANAILLMGGAVVGALAYTFSDSFWFSAVEAEVYGMSSFFTAFVFWAMLKWEVIENEAAQNRWLIMIFYMMGLSIGVHLLNLVTIPALALIYYYKKYPNPSLKGIIVAMAVGLGIVLLINNFMIPGLPTLAGKFEIFFVNELSLPFGAGIIFFMIAFLGSIVYGIIWSQKNNRELINLALLCTTVVLIGYSSYAIVLIRSNFDTPIDENDPEDIIRFVSYLKREQYGDRPLLFGRMFDAQRTGTQIGEPKYRKGETKYEIYDYKIEPIYDPNRSIPFPRMYSQQEGHPELYRGWVGLREGQKPTMWHNIKYLFIFQFGHIYFRYFMWNFAGRDGDDKDATFLMPWESDKDMPDEIARNRARDNFYCIPLILGLLGLIFQYNKDRNNFFVSLLLFFLTGLALVLYLNSPPVEPRERDYIYVGSFYVFAIWIGFGVYALADILGKFLKSDLLRASVATLLCLLVPTMMGAKSWDNHDRSGRYHSVDQARNTLESCAPNAILFTGGDNDTFPLWYAQEVEGVRTDVRVVVLSYFSTDWYIEQMKRKVYKSEALPIKMEQVNYLEGTNDFLQLVGGKDANMPVNLKAYINLLNKRDPRVMVNYNGEEMGVLVSRNFFLNVDSAAVAAKGIVPKGKENRIVSRMDFGLMNNGNYILKSDLAILDILANFNWDRPIYFNNTSANTASIDLRRYLHMEGMTFRLLPVVAQNIGGDMGEVNVEAMKASLAKFQFRGFEDEKVYHDEEYRKFGANELNCYYRLALELFQQNQKEEALKYLDEGIKNIPDKSIPFSYFIPRYIELYYLLGQREKATQMSDLVGKRAIDNMNYIIKSGKKYDLIKQRSMLVLNQLTNVYKNAAEVKSGQIQRQKAINEAKANGQIGMLQGITEEGDIDKLQEEQNFYNEQFKKYSDAFYGYIRAGVN